MERVVRKKTFHIVIPVTQTLFRAVPSGIMLWVHGIPPESRLALSRRRMLLLLWKGGKTRSAIVSRASTQAQQAYLTASPEGGVQKHWSWKVVRRAPASSPTPSSEMAGLRWRRHS